MVKINSLLTTFRSIFTNLRKLLQLMWSEDKGLVTGYYATSGIMAFFPVITSYIYKLLVDNLVAVQGIAPSIPTVLIFVLSGYYLVSIISDFVSWGLRNIYFDFLFRYRIQTALNYKFFNKVSGLDIAHLENSKTQDLITKSEDTFTWRPPDFLAQFSRLFSNFVAYFTSAILLFPFGWWIPFILTIFTLPRLLLRAKYGKLQWSIYGSGAPEVKKLWYLRWLLATKEAIVESRIFQSRDSILARFKGIQEHLYKINSKPVKEYLNVVIFPQIAETAITLIIAFWKLPRVLSGDMSIGNFTFFISLVSRVVDMAAAMVLNFGEMYENNLYVDHFFEVMSLGKIIKEPSNPKRIGILKEAPKIEFKNVSFAYPGTNTKVLQDVSFVINPKENVAVVGKNGAGKTTIVKLLARFYDVIDGEILINGINIKEVSLSEWYKCLGTLFQEFMHYDFTVRENIMLGSPGKEDERLMRKAAKMSGAEGFIDSLPMKYDQVLGRQFEGGSELSQGQWQKIAIARAFYEGAPILILDEPTSAIDAEAEYEIFESLKKYYKDKTLFLISHRFSTVRNADKIIVLDKGKIVEEGNHESLIKQNGIYKRMFEKQASGYK